MTFLYNCRHAGDEYRITKFDEHYVPVEGSSYLCTHKECDCPAGQRPMCRHREMLPKFIARDKVNTGWMYDYDRGGWVQAFDDDDPPPAEVPAPEPMPPLPAGVTMVTLDDPELLWNAIADAVGEPRIQSRPKYPAWRRL